MPLDENAIRRAVLRASAMLAARDSLGQDRGPYSRHIDLGSAPLEAVVSAASCGRPLSRVLVRGGMRVLDVGCGAGVDAFLASREVGPRGKVIGIDISPDMVLKARGAAAKYGYANTDFRVGEAERLPVGDRTADVVISNCVLNMVPDKRAALREMFRVLRPGGWLSASDLASSGGRRDRGEARPDDWAMNGAGAVTASSFRMMLGAAGFRSVHGQVERRQKRRGRYPRDAVIRTVAWTGRRLR